MLASLTSAVRPISGYSHDFFVPMEVLAAYEENPLLFSLVDAAKMRGYNGKEASAEIYHAYHLSLFNGRANKAYDHGFVSKRWADPIVWCVPTEEDCTFLDSDLPFFTPSRLEYQLGREAHGRSLRHIESNPSAVEYASFVVVHRVPDVLYTCVDRNKCVGLLLNGTTLPIVMSDRRTAMSMLQPSQVLMRVMTVFLDIGKLYPEVPTGPNIGLRFVYVHYNQALPAGALDVVRG